jgi:hypothetical protein
MRHSVLSAAVLLLGVTALLAGPAQAPVVEDILRAAGEYVKGYERALALVAEESYTQQVFANRRTLQSDILFMQDDQFGWMEYRDIAAVDARPVRDRQDRLLALFTKPNADRLAQARRIVDEGARFNLNPPDLRLNRTINLPLTAIRFLRAADQYRSHFNIPPQNRSGGVVSLEFTEEHRPRLISTPDQAAATGRFDIELATGRVLSSTLTLRSRSANATMEVKFSPNAQVGLNLPVSMTEKYVGSFNGVITGSASYSRYRQFKVETSEVMKH